MRCGHHPAVATCLLDQVVVGSPSPSPTMSNPSKSTTILVTEAAALVPLGPRRFRQVVGLETVDGRERLGLAYVNGRAVINRAMAMVEVERLHAERCARTRLRQDNLGRFSEPCDVDPETGERLCVEEGCEAVADGRGKLCIPHRTARAKARAARQRRHKVSMMRAGRDHRFFDVPACAAVGDVITADRQR